MNGLHIQEYKIRELIGEGTLGTVYAAEHPQLGGKAAIKVLHHARIDDRDQAALFVSDAQAAQAIRHPHLVDIIEAGILPAGQLYLMTELLAGETLGERLRRVITLPAPDVLDFAAQAASALDAAHERGIIHGRLTREDLFLIPDLSMPRGERVKLLDLGTARLHGSGPDHGVPGGSAIYLAPEQSQPETAVDRRADIYALGGLLYHALCGTPPFLADTHAELVEMHLHRKPAPLRSINREIPSHVEAAILRALAKRPQDRFPTMTAFIDALSRRGRAGPQLSRFRVASVVMALAFSATLLWSARSPAPLSIRPLRRAFLGSVPLPFLGREAPIHGVPRLSHIVRHPSIIPLAPIFGPPAPARLPTAGHRPPHRPRVDPGDPWSRRH